MSTGVDSVVQPIQVHGKLALRRKKVLDNRFGSGYILGALPFYRCAASFPYSLECFSCLPGDKCSFKAGSSEILHAHEQCSGRSMSFLEDFGKIKIGEIPD